jgi:hypothetical protein
MCFWCSKLRLDCATSPSMAGEGQYVGRADCQVCLVKRSTAITVMFVIFAGLCIYNVNIGWYGAGPSAEVIAWQ